MVPLSLLSLSKKAGPSPAGRRWRVARRMRAGRFVANIREEATDPHPSRFASHPLPEGEGVTFAQKSTIFPAKRSGVRLSRSCALARLRRRHVRTCVHRSPTLAVTAHD